MEQEQTIFALSSGALPAAIAVIRVSGPRALDAARALTTRDLPTSRQAGLRRFIDPASRELLDEGLLLCFPGPNTETGENLVEFHCHGSLAVVRGLEVALGRLKGVRAARAGEFTRRAFLNGRMDLAGVEGLGALIEAETTAQRRAAMAMLGGALSRQVDDWTNRLRWSAASIEALLDFSDETDVGQSGADLEALREEIDRVRREIEGVLCRPSAERLRDGVRVALGGPPNAGKSTLLNRLVGREAAIVTEHAGTTRDVIEVPVAIDGIAYLFLDLAGLRDSSDPIERIGIERAEAVLSLADIVLWLGSASDLPSSIRGSVVQIAAKSDLGAASEEGLAVSALTGDGISELFSILHEVARPFVPAPGDVALTVRQRDALGRSISALEPVEELYDEILIAECLRMALVAFDELTGRSTTEAVLDELFGAFCIGK